MSFIEFMTTYWDWYLAIGIIFGIHESMREIGQDGANIFSLSVICLLVAVLWPICLIMYLSKN